VEARSAKIGKGCCSSPVLLNLYSKYITKKVIGGFVESKIGG